MFHFGPDDAQYFFGRDIFIEEIYSAIETRHFLPILGASGSGKSSVVFAGLVPKLQQEGNWLFTHFRPGSDPFYALSLALIDIYAPNLNETEGILQSRQLSTSLSEGEISLTDIFTKIQNNYPNQRLLLIADQFEELYTFCDDLKIQQNFLNVLMSNFSQDKILGLSSLSNLSPVLVITMRTDFLGNALSYPDFADLLRKNDTKIRSMNHKELTEVIEKPAHELGVTFESGLVDHILDDIEAQPGNLPLLEFALTELWNQENSKKLTHKIYNKIGQVKGALASYANEKYNEFSDDKKEKIRRIFIELVRPGQGTEYTRRIATKEELGDENWSLVKRLADARLVLTSHNAMGQDTVELIHEILIKKWQTLGDWIEDSREFLIWKERLNTRIEEGELLTKSSLKIAQEKLSEREPDLNEKQKKFIKKSQQQQLIKRFLLGSVASLMGIFVFGAGIQMYKQSCDVGERIGQDCFRFIITSGDSQLFLGTTNNHLENGVKNFKSAFFDSRDKSEKNPEKNTEKIDKVIQNFKDAKNTARFDPIALIYYNNAIALERENPYKLAVVVPVDTHAEVARNMLRGVALKQDEFNQQRQRKDENLPLLELVIANDKNVAFSKAMRYIFLFPVPCFLFPQPKSFPPQYGKCYNNHISQEIARKLVNKEVLGIIGHRSSSSSLAAVEIYNQHKIAMISPTSSSTELDEYEVFFRTVASNKEYAEKFYSYGQENCFSDRNKKMWVLYDSQDKYSNNLKKEIELLEDNSTYPNKQLIFEEFNDSFSARELLNEGVECVILLPGTTTTRSALLIISKYKELYERKTNKTNTLKQIKFLSGLALHNHEDLKKDGGYFYEELFVIVPTPFIKNETNNELVTSWNELVTRWGGNVSWRTYSSYQAVENFVKAFEEIERVKGEEEKTSKKKQKLVFDYLKDTIEKNQGNSCLMNTKDIEDNTYDQENCLY
ncbi:MAG: ABC transporter substrate-binding protein [Crocosphaera sp.]